MEVNMFANHVHFQADCTKVCARRCRNKIVKQRQDSTKENSYQEALPDSCIEFSSPAGKQLFKEALGTGYMDCYFKLAGQFLTQDEPTFCGLSTLVMVLNALSVDPGRVWKGPWRWYHESMLDCCTSLRVALEKGVTFDQFACLAECNSLCVKPVRATSRLTVEQFRDDVKKCTSQDDTVLVVSFARSGLGQSGDGHFSPIGGYHSEKDLVLVLDVARYKYPSHWVPVSTLLSAIKLIDCETGKPRGYLTMSRHSHLDQLLSCFSPNQSESLGQERHFLSQWVDWLDEDATDTPGSECDVMCVINKAMDALIQIVQCLKEPSCFLTSLVDVNCQEHASQGHLCATKCLIKSVEDHKMFQLVSMAIEEYLKSETKELLHRICKSAGQVECSGENVKCCELQHLISPSHFFTTLLLCWPYRTLDNRTTTNAALLENFVRDPSQKMPNLLRNKVNSLRQQFATILTI